jgi:hypothetical protein
MSNSPTPPHERARHELRVQPLLASERAYALPCDALGRVDMGALSELERNEYFFARKLAGHRFSLAIVEIEEKSLC